MELPNQDHLALEYYKKHCLQHDLLSVEDEARLFNEYSNGSEEAFDKIVNSNLRLVMNVASVYAKTHSTMLMDLVSAGNEGLIKAAKDFDLSTGNRFSTHAMWWIRSKVNEEFNKSTNTVRVPRNVMRQLSQIHNLEQENKSIPEIAEELEVDVSKIHLLQAMTNRYVDRIDREELVKDERESIAEAMDFLTVHNKLNAFLDALPERERGLIVNSYMTPPEKRIGLVELGKMYGVSKNSIINWKKKALSMLREQFSDAGIYEV